MSHEITITDGKAEAFYALTPAWHGLGVVTDGVLTSDEAIETAGLDWTVGQFPIGVPILGDDDQTVIGYEASTAHQINRRMDTGLDLGVVGMGTSVLQNRDAFSWLDSLFQDDVLRYEAAFSLSGGRTVVLVAKIPTRFVIADGDEVEPYIVFSMAHDGTGAIKAGLTMVRVVCANTLRLADRDLVTISHRNKDLGAALAKAKEVIAEAMIEFRMHADVCEKLVDRKFSDAEWEAYLNLCCPFLDEKDPNYTPRRQNAITQVRSEIEVCYRESETNNLDSIAGTAWAAYNAMSEHVDHMPRRGSDDRARMEARYRVTQSGTGHNFKTYAFKAACNFAGIDSKTGEEIGIEDGAVVTA